MAKQEIVVFTLLGSRLKYENYFKSAKIIREGTQLL